MQQNNDSALPMKNGWTGGQYSLLRALFGVYLLIQFAMLIPSSDLRGRALLILAVLASIALAIGFRDRIAALILCAILVWLFGRNPLMLFAGLMLLLHAALPGAPYGSWDARGRVDPRGGWSYSPPLYLMAWIATAIGYGYFGWTKLMNRSELDAMTWAVVALQLLFAPLALFRRARPIIWTLALLLFAFADLSLGMIVVQLFTFDPRWIPRLAPESVDDVFYDGTCGLCHRAIRFMISEDTAGTSFRFAPLGGDAFAALIGNVPGLPDSMVVRTPDGTLLLKSDAALHVGKRLGGIWRALATIGGVVPRSLRNVVYDFIARIRYRLFTRPKEACPMLPPDLRKRFSA